MSICVHLHAWTGVPTCLSFPAKIFPPSNEPPYLKLQKNIKQNCYLKCGRAENGTDRETEMKRGIKKKKNCQHGSNSCYFRLKNGEVWSVKGKLILVRGPLYVIHAPNYVCLCVFKPHTVLKNLPLTKRSASCHRGTPIKQHHNILGGKERTKKNSSTTHKHARSL